MNDLIDYAPCTDNLRQAMLSRITPPFHEGANLRAFLDVFLFELEEVERLACTLLDSFNVETAVGEQLDTLGIAAGLSRTVCRVRRLLFFGFNTPGTPTDVQGLGIGRWYRPGMARFADYTFPDDATYRRYIRIKIASDSFDGTLARYQEIARHLFDGTELDGSDSDTGTTRVTAQGFGRVTVRVYRDLTAGEIELAELYKYVLPFYGGYNIVIAAGADRFQLSCKPDNGSGFGKNFAEIY